MSNVVSLILVPAGGVLTICILLQSCDYDAPQQKYHQLLRCYNDNFRPETNFSLRKALGALPRSAEKRRPVRAFVLSLCKH
jgi:hypothetical protein